MGKEQRAREAREAIGRFNVHLIIHYIDGQRMEGDFKSWNHVGDFIACDTYTGELKIFCLKHCLYFEVSNIESTPNLIETPDSELN